MPMIPELRVRNPRFGTEQQVERVYACVATTNESVSVYCGQVETTGGGEWWRRLFASLDYHIVRDKFRKRPISRKSRRKMARKWHS